MRPGAKGEATLMSTFPFPRNAARTGRTAAAVFLVLFAFSSFAQTAKLGGGLDQQLASASSTDKLEVIVTFQGDTISDSQMSALRSLGISNGVAMRSLPIAGVLATPAQIQALARMAGVRSLWANKKLTWFNYETTAVTGVQKLQTDPVMIARNNGLPYLGTGVGVVVNDTGIDGTSADLQYPTHVVQNVQGATNLHAVNDMAPITYLENQPDTDTAGHGTHVAGTVGGNGARSGGKYAGAAPGAKIVGYGSGLVIFVLDGVGGFDYAVTNQATYNIRVITNSFGTSDPTVDPDDPLVVATYKAYKRGIAVVFAAGNDGPGLDTLNPYAKLPWVIGVAATDKQGRLTDFSSRGVDGDKQTIVEDGETWTVLNQPTIGAPGRFIISVRASGETNSLIAGDAGPQEDANRIEPAYLPFYTVLTGTSQATPHVAGVIALMLQANPKLGPLDVKSILQQTATNIPGRAAWEAGAGMVNAYAAVDRAAVSTRGYGKTVNALRTFNSNVVATTTKSNFTVDYNPVISQAPTGNKYTFQVGANTEQLAVNIQALGVQNGVQDTGNPIDLFLIAPDGAEYESAVPVAFTVFTGRSVVVDAPAPGTWTVYLRALVGVQGNDVSTVPETVTGSIYTITAGAVTGLNDIGKSPAASAIKVAVSERLVDGVGGGSFQPNSNLARIDMANYLTMGAATRQFLPVDGTRTFADVTAAQTEFAESAAVKGAALRDMFFSARGVEPATSPGVFSPKGNVSRAQLAYSLVQSLGLEGQALQLNGQQVTVVYQAQRIPIEDAGSIPAGLAGYVQLALDLNLMNAYFTVTQGPFDLQPVVHATFKPLNNVTRAEYAVSATRLLGVYNTE